MTKTILIVDDSVTMVMSVRATLEMNGFKVETRATAWLRSASSRPA
jgi:two-component system chemotaxis response regulator CheY